MGSREEHQHLQSNVAVVAQIGEQEKHRLLVASLFWFRGWLVTVTLQVVSFVFLPLRLLEKTALRLSLKQKYPREPQLSLPASAYWNADSINIFTEITGKFLSLFAYIYQKKKGQ